MSADSIMALIPLAVAAGLGFCVGRQSLWDRVTSVEDDAAFNKAGRAVHRMAKAHIAMASCCGSAVTITSSAVIEMPDCPRVRLTFEVVA